MQRLPEISYMDNLKTVSEAAKIIGVSPDTIRRWDKRRMIKSYRSNNNHRLFNLKEIERINNKVSGKNLKTFIKFLKQKNVLNIHLLSYLLEQVVLL